MPCRASSRGPLLALRFDHFGLTTKGGFALRFDHLHRVADPGAAARYSISVSRHACLRPTARPVPAGALQPPPPPPPDSAAPAP